MARAVGVHPRRRGRHGVHRPRRHVGGRGQRHHRLPGDRLADATDLLLVTHEHVDHNGVEAIGGEPVVLRSTAGRLESPIGEVVAIASEHDAAAGTERAARTRSSSSTSTASASPTSATSARRRCAPSRRAHLDGIDLLFVPVGGGPTLGGAQAAEIASDRPLSPGRADALPHPADRLPRDRGGSLVDGDAEGPAPEVAVVRAYRRPEKGDGPVAVVVAAPSYVERCLF